MFASFFDVKDDSLISQTAKPNAITVVLAPFYKKSIFN